MKGKSKILALLIIMMLVLSMGLVACDRSEDGKPDDGAKPAPITWSEWTVTSIPTADKVTGAMTLTAQFYDAGLAFNYIDGDETKDIVLTKYTGAASTLVILDHIFAMSNKRVVEIVDSAFIAL